MVASSSSLASGRRGTNHATAADHRDPVGDGLDLTELVGDEHDRLAVSLSAPHDVEQFIGLLRRQHGGRLVEDEQVDIPSQCLDDLDSLLDADGQVLDHRVRVDRQPVAARHLEDEFAGGTVVQEAQESTRTFSTPSITFSATVNTGTSMKCWWTMPMPAAIASLGRWIFGGDAVNEDLALIRLEQPVEDVHQRRLARAVLAEQGVDLARFDGQVDVVVGDESAEALGDAAQFESQRTPPRP